MSIRVLIFDLDDTLVESERLNERILDDFLSREYGVTITPEDREKQYQCTWKEVFTFLSVEYGIKEGWEALWEKYFTEKRRYFAGHALRVARGAQDLLSLPLPKAIVSGSEREEIFLMLESARILRGTFQAIVSADDCQNGKPDPEGYLKALAALGAAPHEALVFEDSPVGIQAARSGGIPVAFVREFARTDLCKEADVCFDAMADAVPWVRERMARAGNSGR